MTDLIRHRSQLFQCTYQLYIFCSPNLAANAMSHRDEAFKTEFANLASPVQVLFLDRIPSVEELMEISQQHQKCLLFIDDFSEQLFVNNLLPLIFTRLSSHSNIDCVVSCHVSFGSRLGKFFSMITQSVNVLVLQNSKADRQTLALMSRKMFPGVKNYLPLAMQKATDILGPFANLVIRCDLSNRLSDKFAVISNLFEADGLPRLYHPSPRP